MCCMNTIYYLLNPAAKVCIPVQNYNIVNIQCDLMICGFPASAANPTCNWLAAAQLQGMWYFSYQYSPNQAQKPTYFQNRTTGARYTINDFIAPNNMTLDVVPTGYRVIANNLLTAKNGVIEPEEVLRQKSFANPPSPYMTFKQANFSSCTGTFVAPAHVYNVENSSDCTIFF